MNQVKVVILIAAEEKHARKILAGLKGLDRAGWVGLTYYPLADENPAALDGLSSDALIAGYSIDDLDSSLVEQLDRAVDEPTLLN